jgi:hypothetical protein
MYFYLNSGQFQQKLDHLLVEHYHKIRNLSQHSALPKGTFSISKLNHFPNSFNMTRKDLMNKNISKMQAKYGGSHFNFLPKTYILPKEYDLLK